MNRAKRPATATARMVLRAPALAAVLAAALPGTLHAQSIAPPTREELEIGKSARQPSADASRLTVDGDIERGPCPLADPSFAAIKVTFSRVNFANLTAVSPEVLAPAWADMAGREMPIASLCEVRDRAATMLRQMGYLAAVQVPPQRIEKDGEVRMDVLIAKLVEVQVRGDPGRNEKLIAAHLAKLTEQQWFNVNEAERHLLLLGDLPGYDVRLTLRPAGRAPGEVVGDVLIKRRPLEVVVGTQNLGPRATGREAVFAQVTLNGLTGLGDRTILSLFNTVQTGEQTVVQLAHDLALGSDGLRLAGSLIYGRSKPSIASSSFKSETVIARTELSYPLVRRQALSLSGAGGLEIVNQSVDFGATRLSEDRLRIAFARLDLDMIDKASLSSRGGFSASEPKWRIGTSIEARQGIAGLGASHDCTPAARCFPPNIPISNILADPSAFLLRMESAFEYRPSPVFTIGVAPRVQYSSSQLLGFEQYSLGNYTIGRGFDPGIVLGDSGAGASFELRYGRLTPRTPQALALQPFAFLDAAWAWNNDNGLTSDPRRVLSAGGGLRARWGNHLDAKLMVAAPLERAGFQTKRGDVRVLFNLTARLVPWDPS